MKIFVAIFFFLIGTLSYAQVDTAIAAKPIKARVISTSKPTKKDTTKAIDTAMYRHFFDSGSITKLDSSILINDSTQTKDSVVATANDTTIYKLLQAFPILNSQQPESRITAFRKINTTDYIFYLLVGIVFLLALIQILFSKYIKNIFNVFFQTSFRQTQTKEQLTQDNIAALLLNILFILSASTFVTLVAQKFNIINFPFWNIFIVAVVIFTTIYLVKLMFTQFMGWVFNRKEAATAYSFIVFIVNKIVGVMLVPFLFLVAFSTNSIKELAFSTAIMLVAFLLFFRLFATYKTLSSRLKINAIHFFLYFCSIEILPLLIMYKLLTNYIGNGI